MFTISEKFTLSFSWETVVYNVLGACEFKGAKFTGPAMQIADPISSNDSIAVDFYSQYFVLVKDVYVGTLSWGEVVYSDDGITANLRDARLTHRSELNKVPTLSDDDWLLIDTVNHVDELHNNYMVYPTYVMKPDKDLYRFSDK